MRPEVPCLMVTADFGHLKCLAMRLINSALALPSTGGDLMWARKVPSSCSSSELLRALGLTLAVMVFMVLY